MHKIIFKFTMVVTSALAGHSGEIRIEAPRLPKPDIRVEKPKPHQAQPIQLVEGKKTALS